MAKIVLRALTKSDIEKTLEWHNQDDIRDLYSGQPFPVNREMEEKWYDKILHSNFPVTVFGIEITNNKKLIGITILKDINLINRNAEFAIYIGDREERGKGYSKEATKKTIEFAFYHIGLKRVTLKVISENKTALKLYENLGFIQEGTLRKSIYKNGKYKDEIVMSILEEEYRKI